MIDEGCKKLYDFNGNWIGIIRTLILTPEEFAHYNKQETKQEPKKELEKDPE